MIGNWNYGTGRRKSAVARVFIKSGKGDIIVNGKPADEYFDRESHHILIRRPLESTEALTLYDVTASVHGGGPAGQAGELRHGIARAVEKMDPSQRTAIDYGVGGVPETFFISRDGTIVRKHAGPVNPALMTEVLEELL